jgi:hypothetical protein
MVVVARHRLGHERVDFRIGQTMAAHLARDAAENRERVAVATDQLDLDVRYFGSVLGFCSAST